MKVHVLTNWQNEHWMSALFFNAYSWVDKITIKLEPTTNDGTQEEISRFQSDPAYKPLIDVVEHSECGGLIDDCVKSDKDMEIIHASDADWMIRVDSDQFVFPRPFGRDPRKALEEVPEERSVIIAAHWQVYRHATDVDVDRTKNPIPQRIHGNPDRSDSYSSGFILPCLFRPRVKPRISVGCHYIVGTDGNEDQIHGGYQILNHEITDTRVHRELWSGSHYRAAEPSECVLRRVDNRLLRLGGWNARLDEGSREGRPMPNRQQLIDELTAEAKAHENDPMVVEI